MRCWPQSSRPSVRCTSEVVLTWFAGTLVETMRLLATEGVVRVETVSGRVPPSCRGVGRLWTNRGRRGRVAGHRPVLSVRREEPEPHREWASYCNWSGLFRSAVAVGTLAEWPPTSKLASVAVRLFSWVSSVFHWETRLLNVVRPLLVYVVLMLGGRTLALVLHRLAGDVDRTCTPRWFAARCGPEQVVRRVLHRGGVVAHGGRRP